MADIPISALFQEVDGTETLYDNDISASRNIAIDFGGGATAGITVTSTGSGNVELLGSVLDPNGTTTINSEHGSIESSGASQILTGANVILDAADGIGAATAPVNVVVGGTIASLAGLGLNAYTANGDINVNAVTGNLPVQAVESASQGAINLTAAGSIGVATNGAGLRSNEVLGLVQGGIITLNSASGGLGNSTTAPLILNTPNPVAGLVDTLTATAQTNVYLEEQTGNLQLNSLTTGGNVWIDVPNGSVVNANTNSTTDTQTEAQLEAGVWSDLGLTATTGYQAQINNTLTSFVSQQDAQYQTYWTDLESGNTGNAGFGELSAVFGPGRTDGGSWITDGFAVGQTITVAGSAGNSTSTEQSYTIAAITAGTITLSANDSIVNEASSATSETVSLQHNTSDTPVAVSKAYFTVGSGATPGTITRTDGSNWLTDGFAVGQTILVTGSAANDTVGATSYTVTAVTAGVLTLSSGDAIVTEASAAAPEAVTVQHTFFYQMTQSQITTLESGIKEWTPQQLLTLFGAGLLKNVADTVVTVGAPDIIAANVTILTPAGAVGDQTGSTVTIDLSYPPNPTTVLTQAQEVALAAAERVDVQYLAGPAITATVNFGISSGVDTTTRTDGGNWSGLAVGDSLTVTGANGQFTQNETDGTLFYLVDAINGNVVTIDPSTPLAAAENGQSVTIAPVVLDPSFQATAAAEPVSVYFTANAATSDGLITRISGSWIADGYAPGQLIEITGSATDSTSQDVPDLITTVTATTITLATEDLIFTEATPAAPETVSITRGISPKPAAIQIDQVSPVTVNATGLISITAADDVYLDSDVDVRLNQVVAGTITIGSQIQIKGEGSILNGASTSTVNLQGGDIVLEAAGLNGDPGTIGTETSSVNVGSIGDGTVTARAEGVVNIADVVVGENAGNLNLETIFSAIGDAILSADGSITASPRSRPTMSSSPPIMARSAIRCPVRSTTSTWTPAGPSLHMHPTTSGSRRAIYS